MMLLRARSLALGYSGVRPVVVDRIVELLNAGITPAVPEHGSLGASGDLAPLAHVALALIGEGDVRGRRGGGRDRTDHVAGQGGPGPDQRHRRHARHARARPRRSRRAAAHRRRHGGDVDRGAARHRPRLRRRPDGAASARRARRRRPANLRRLLDGSADRRQPPHRRSACAGRLLAALHAAGARRGPRRRGERHRRRPTSSCARRSTTRPCCRTAASSRAATSTARRSACSATSWRSPPPRSGRSPSDAPTGCSIRRPSHGLPPFLVEDAGVNSGLMIVQYTQAAMVAENRRLAAPASVDSMPTSAMQEDHVSMGWSAARKLRRAVANLGRILACELVCAARGLELRAPLRPAAGTAAAVCRPARRRRSGAGPDRWLSPELAVAERLVHVRSVSSPRWSRRSVRSDGHRPGRSAVTACRATARCAPLGVRRCPAGAGRRRRRCGC